MGTVKRKVHGLFLLWQQADFQFAFCRFTCTKIPARQSHAQARLGQPAEIRHGDLSFCALPLLLGRIDRNLHINSLARQRDQTENRHNKHTHGNRECACIVFKQVKDRRQRNGSNP